MTNETTWMSSFLDDMSYGLAADITSLENLPDEIMLAIMGSLDRPDLLRLALVCRRILPVAQQILYKCIRGNDKGTLPRLDLLCQTFQDQPHLSRLVQSIEIRPDTCSNKKRVIRIHAARFLRPDDPYCDLDTIEVGASDTRITGIILSLLPHLKELTISVAPLDPDADRRNSWVSFDNGWGGWANGWDELWDDRAKDLGDRSVPFFAIFGFDQFSWKSVKARELCRVAAFRNLERIRFEGSEFPWALSLLPKLISLHIGEDTSYYVDQNKNKTLEKSKVAELSVECDTKIFEPDRAQRYRAFEGFLHMFSTLKAIEIHISTRWEPESTELGHCSRLIDRLEVLGATLEKLRLFTKPPKLDDPILSLNLKPLGSLTSFSKVRELSIPNDWLDIGQSDTDYSKVFPPSIEVLELLQPNHKTCSWLADFANQRMKRRNHVSLRKIKIICVDGFESTYEAMRYYPGPCAMLDLLRNQGVIVDLACTTRRSEWDDDNYNPCVALFLEELKAYNPSFMSLGNGMVWDGFTEKAARMSGYCRVQIEHVNLPSRRIQYRFQ